MEILPPYRLAFPLLIRVSFCVFLISVKELKSRLRRTLEKHFITVKEQQGKQAVNLHSWQGEGDEERLLS